MRLTSPQVMGSYLGGLLSLVHVGSTPHFSLKLNPKKKGMLYLSTGAWL